MTILPLILFVFAYLLSNLFKNIIYYPFIFVLLLIYSFSHLTHFFNDVKIWKNIVYYSEKKSVIEMIVLDSKNEPYQLQILTDYSHRRSAVEYLYITQQKNSLPSKFNLSNNPLIAISNESSSKSYTVVEKPHVIFESDQIKFKANDLWNTIGINDLDEKVYNSEKHIVFRKFLNLNRI